MFLVEILLEIEAVIGKEIVVDANQVVTGRLEEESHTNLYGMGIVVTVALNGEVVGEVEM